MFLTFSTKACTLWPESRIWREHLEHGLVGAAVQRARERVDARRDRREHVGAGRADEAHGRGRGVLLVVGVQDQQLVERLDEHRVHLVIFGHVAEVEAQEVLDEAELVLGVEERLADRLLVRVGGEHGQLGQQADGVDLDELFDRGVERALVVGRHRLEAAREHRHRVRGVRHALEVVAHVFVQQGVAANLAVERRELIGGGQLAVDQQVGDLEKARLAASSSIG